MIDPHRNPLRLAQESAQNRGQVLRYPHEISIENKKMSEEETFMVFGDLIYRQTN
jgi:hypothetical protein